jgi:hypothetical protein
VSPPLLAGVAPAPRLPFWRYGDSGLKDGLAWEGRLGLGARAPGPTDCENFGFGIEGVSGLKLGFSIVDRLKLLWYEGVVGSGAKSDESAETRF